MSECWSCLTERLTLIASGGSAGRSVCICRAWRQASRSTQRPIGTIRPVSSASGMKVSGPSMPALGVMPAQQRLDAGGAAVAEVHERLVVELELP